MKIAAIHSRDEEDETMGASIYCRVHCEPKKQREKKEEGEADAGNRYIYIYVHISIHGRAKPPRSPHRWFVHITARDETCTRQLRYTG